MRGAVCLPRRVSEEPLCHDAGWRARPQLPVPELQEVFHPHHKVYECDGEAGRPGSAGVIDHGCHQGSVGDHNQLMRNERYMKRENLLTMAALTSAVTFVGDAYAQQPVYQGKVGRTLAESKEWWPDPVKAPAGAPNVVWILLDDVGFGASATFGGLIRTPTFDALAANGLRYTNFHTTAICAPTRSALLTGRNSASVHVAGFSHTILSARFPGWDGRMPATAGTIAEILRDNGYNTFAVGKYGVTPDEEAT